jgi:hypothetical protein
MRLTMRSARPHRVPGHVLLPGLLGALCGATQSAAHNAPPSGALPVVVDGALWGGGTSWGVVERAADGEPTGTCEEVFGATLRFYAAVETSSGPRLLVGTSSGVFVTDDGGCTIHPVPGLVDHSPTAVAHVDETIYIVTASSDRDNGLFVSVDAGQTFVPRGPQRGDLILTSIAVDATASHVWMAGFTREPVKPVLLVSSDGGETFDDQSGRFPTAIQLRVLAADDAGVDPPGVMLVYVDGNRRNHLIRADHSVTALEYEVEVIGEIGAWVRHAGRAFITVNQNDLRLVEDHATTSIPGGPTHCLRTIPGDERLWGCGQVRHGAFFLSSTDGLTWQPELPITSQLRPRQCPTPSTAATVCATDPPDDTAPDLPAPQPPGDADDEPTPPTADPTTPTSPTSPPDDSSGCAAMTPAGVWPIATALAALAALLRRRAPRARSPYPQTARSASP